MRPDPDATSRATGGDIVSEKPIDRFWWCRDDEKFARERWEKIERPLLIEMFKKFDDPKFWEVPTHTIHWRD